MPIGSVTHRTVSGVDFVAFGDACVQICRCWRNALAAAPTNQEMFCLGREKGFEMAGLLKCVEPYLSKPDDREGNQRQGNNYTENPALHAIGPGKETIKKRRESLAKRSALSAGHDAALIAATLIVLVALSKVPVTSTFCPANGAGFF